MAISKIGSNSINQAADTILCGTSGNVGIGTSSPNSKLEISGSSTFIPTTTITADNAVTGWRVRRTGGTYPREYYMGIRENSTALDFYDNTADALRARIDSSGNLLVGTTTQVRSGDRFSVKGAGAQLASFEQQTNTSGYSAIATLIGSNGNNTSTYHLWANTNAVGNWYLYGNGTSSFSSDERLKKNIETARDGYVEDLCKLRVVKYNWRNDADNTPKEIGLIAQEVEQVFAGLVQEDLNPVEEGGEKFKQLKASVLPFIMLKAIQEQQAIITQLQADVAALKGQA